MISVLQATAWYPPAYVGGTEIYLSGLISELRALGISSRIAAPLDVRGLAEYEFEGTKVSTFPVDRPTELHGELLGIGMDRFRQLLAADRTDIYHQHSWTRGLGAAHLRTAHEAGYKTVLTVHTPTPLCLRGTMMRFGKSVCDGHIDPKTCSACWCAARGAPEFAARSLSAIPPAISAALGQFSLGRAATALSARWLGERRKAEFAEMMKHADRVVAVCRWLFEALACNGVPAQKLVLSRQGLNRSFAQDAIHAVSTRVEAPDRPFQLLYIGRWNPMKGVDVLVRAVRAVPPEVPVALSIHGIANGTEDLTYAAHVRSLAAGDDRIVIKPPLSRKALAQTLAHASALAVPSLWLETGPLVVLEARAAGLPVIGSRLGGIAELVHEPEDGLLVPPGDVMAWAGAIQHMAANCARPAKTEMASIRTMQDVANEMAALYTSLSASSGVSAEA